VKLCQFRNGCLSLDLRVSKSGSNLIHIFLVKKRNKEIGSTVEMGRDLSQQQQTDEDMEAQLPGQAILETIDNATATPVQHYVVNHALKPGELNADDILAGGGKLQNGPSS
jgi:hypothetical protein